MENERLLDPKFNPPIDENDIPLSQWPKWAANHETLFDRYVAAALTGTLSHSADDGTNLERRVEAAHMAAIATLEARARLFGVDPAPTRAEGEAR